MKNEANGLTLRAAFDDIPIINDQLFEVRPGVPVNFAISKAICLVDSIKHLAIEDVGNGVGMDTAKVYLVQVAAEMIQALMESIDDRQWSSEATP